MDIQKTHFVFDAVADKYDRCNRLFSFGIDRGWRKRLVKMVQPHPNQQVLDLCCGTGEAVFCFLRYTLARTVTGADISEPMLDLAQEKQIRFSSRSWMQNKTIIWRLCDAAQTGLDPGNFDVVTCAFGIRNIPDRQAALNEMHRLLKPRGKLGILEFSLPANSLLRGFYKAYLSRLMPYFAKPVIGAIQPLQYLAESVCDWHTRVDFAGELDKAGFKLIRKTPLTGGIATLWLAHSR